MERPGGECIQDRKTVIENVRYTEYEFRILNNWNNK